MDRAPISTLWEAVNAQTGFAAGWPVNDLHNHERRYLADLAIVARSAPLPAI